MAQKDAKIAELCERIEDQDVLKQELEMNSIELHEVRQQSAIEHAKFEMQVKGLDERFESTAEWFTVQIQDLEMEL